MCIRFPPQKCSTENVCMLSFYSSLVSTSWRSMMLKDITCSNRCNHSTNSYCTLFTSTQLTIKLKKKLRHPIEWQNKCLLFRCGYIILLYYIVLCKRHHHYIFNRICNDLIWLGLALEHVFVHSECLMIQLTFMKNTIVLWPL